MRIVGIDPGVSPAFAFTNGIGKPGSTVLRIPQAKYGFNLETARAAIAQEMPDKAVLEMVGVMSSDSVSSAGHFMVAWGMLHGLLFAMHIPFILVTPPVWKKKLLEGGGYDMGRDGDPKLRKDIQKQSALRWVSTNFPAVPLYAKGSRVPDHNVAEAVLLSSYGHLHG